MVRPVLMDLKRQYKDQIDIIQINADDEPALMKQYGVMSIPTLIVFQQGQEVERYVGARPRDFYEYMFRQLSCDDILPHDPPSPAFRLLMFVIGLVMFLYGLDRALYLIASAGGLLILAAVVDLLAIWKRIHNWWRKRGKQQA